MINVKDPLSIDCVQSSDNEHVEDKLYTLGLIVPTCCEI